MKTGLFAAKVLIVAGALVVAAWAREPVEQTFQGWVEANFVFIGPDELGRVEKLAVHEGDTVVEGAPLFTVDADLHRAAVSQTEAILANAQQTFNRVVEEFPDSPFNADAKRELDALKKT